MATRNYVYSANRPTEGEDLLFDIFVKAHRYYNRLVEIERQRCADFAAMRKRLCPEIAEMEAERDRLLQAIADHRDGMRETNAVMRQKRVAPEDRKAIVDLKAQLAKVKEALKERKESLKSDLDFQRANEELTLAYDGVPILGSEPLRREGGHFKVARSESELHNGTYLQVEAAFEAAKKKTKFGPPRFARWEEWIGYAGVQLQGGMQVDDLRGSDNRLRMETIAGRGASAALVTFAVRVDTTDKGKPIWARLPVFMGRPLPADARIKWARISCERGPERRYGDGSWRRYARWSLMLTIDTGEQKVCGETGACGIDIGWRTLDDGSLRVAVACGDDGHEEELRLSPKLLSRWAKARSLQEIRDRSFNATKALVADVLAKETCPDAMRLELSHLAQWRDHGRLCRAVDRWMKEWPAVGADVLPALKEWREHEAHLVQYERGTVARGERMREGLYRQWAAKLRKRYKRLVVEKFDLRQMMRRKPAEQDDSPENATARFNSRVAAVGMLRQWLKENGAIAVPAKNSTRECHVCGAIEEWDQENELAHACVNGHTWDQDYNAARVLLARGKVMDENPGDSRESEDGQSVDDAAASEKKGGRWARRKADRSRKEAEIRKETAVV